mmetsp:Transcript_34540/g.111506  ORF Transcript_34540/g.111506 Transcript_34540/m.111506 type:complete len:203 (+) Transcript_34540:291-899(+)
MRQLPLRRDGHVCDGMGLGKGASRTGRVHGLRRRRHERGAHVHLHVLRARRAGDPRLSLLGVLGAHGGADRPGSVHLDPGDHVHGRLGGPEDPQPILGAAGGGGAVRRVQAHHAGCQPARGCHSHRPLRRRRVACPRAPTVGLNCLARRRPRQGDHVGAAAAWRAAGCDGLRAADEHARQGHARRLRRRDRDTARRAECAQG